MYAHVQAYTLTRTSQLQTCAAQSSARLRRTIMYRHAAQISGMRPPASSAASSPSSWFCSTGASCPSAQTVNVSQKSLSTMRPPASSAPSSTGTSCPNAQAVYVHQKINLVLNHATASKSSDCWAMAASCPNAQAVTSKFKYRSQPCDRLLSLFLFHGRFLPKRTSCQCPSTSKSHYQPCDRLLRIFLCHHGLQPFLPKRTRRQCTSTT